MLRVFSRRALATGTGSLQHARNVRRRVPPQVQRELEDATLGEVQAKIDAKAERNATPANSEEMGGPRGAFCVPPRCRAAPAHRLASPPCRPNHFFRR